LLVSFRIFVAAAVVMGLPALLQAQYGRNPYGGRQPAVQGQPVEIRGTIQGVMRGGILVLDSNTQTAWKIAILPATKIQVTGTTTTDSLRSGQLLELTAMIDAKGAISDKVDEVTITSITPQRQIGLYPAGEGDAGADNQAAAGDAPKGKGGKATKPDKRKGAGHGKAAGAVAAGKYRIVGKLVVNRGAYSIQAGRTTLPFQLADDATIKVDLADLSAVKQGNEVAVAGMMMPNRPGLAQAHQVKVTLPEVAVEGNKRPAKPGDKQPRGAEKGKDKDKNPGLPAPAPEK
jgi:hypothetical protein